MAAAWIRLFPVATELAPTKKNQIFTFLVLSHSVALGVISINLLLLVQHVTIVVLYTVDMAGKRCPSSPKHIENDSKTVKDVASVPASCETCEPSRVVPLLHSCLTSDLLSSQFLLSSPDSCPSFSSFSSPLSVPLTFENRPPHGTIFKSR